MEPPPNQDSQAARDRRLGLSAAFAAYLSWGVMPGYFRWVDHVGSLEIVAHRIIWAIPVLALFLWVRDRAALFAKLRISVSDLAWLAVSALLLSGNWLIFVWAVTNEQVIATGLGYFINPLVNVLLGSLFLGESLTANQKVAVSIAAAGTAYLGWYLGAAPWVSLGLPLFFGFYGLVRKRLGVGPMTGLMWENLLLLAPALAWLAWSNAQGGMDFLHLDPGTDALLVLAGLVTILPLIWFNTATRFLPYTVVGFIQYLSPSISVLLAVFVWKEPFTQGHLVAFSCIWGGLALITAEQVRIVRRRRRVA